jgi:hypothetical protein
MREKSIIFRQMRYWRSTAGPLPAEGLATASSEDVVKLYAQLRQLQVGEQTTIAENGVWKQDAGTPRLLQGRIDFRFFFPSGALLYYLWIAPQKIREEDRFAVWPFSLLSCPLTWLHCSPGFHT